MSALGGDVMPPPGTGPEDTSYLDERLAVAASLNIPGAEVQLNRMVTVDEICERSIRGLSRLCLRSGRELPRKPYTRR